MTARGFREGAGELLFNGYRVWDNDNDKVLEMDSGDSSAFPCLCFSSLLALLPTEDWIHSFLLLINSAQLLFHLLYSLASL